jgi:hypothetical protein
MNTITLTIPSNWLEGETLSQDELRQALKIGLAQLRQQQITQETEARVVQAFLNTGRVRHLSTVLPDSEESNAERQPPPELPGPPVSEILIAQRRGEF